MQATLVQEREQAYVAGYAVRRDALGGGPELLSLRDAAIARFAALGFPTTHDEAWRFTNLAPFLKTYYGPAPHRTTTPPATPALVFVNGRFAPEASTAMEAPGLKILVERAFQPAAGVLPGVSANFENNALAALNTAMFEGGARIEIADGAVLEQPLVLMFLTLGDAPIAVYPRTLVVAGRDSQAQIVEIYGGAGAHFTNAVTEVLAGDGAVIEHYKLQQEDERSLHYGMLAVRQGASSSFTSHNIALGGALARNEIAVVLDGEGADCQLNGLYMGRGTQHIDNYTTLDHARPHSTSHELYKGILDSAAHAVFHGRIIVRPEAQKTDAIQRNKNLLLSKDAVINTKPQLEIYADDVKCTHGATVGQVDEEAVFYLRSRGIPLEEARALLTYAFTAELVEKIKVESIRAELEKTLRARLGSGK
jgi:Fe-S cluster assembly protein SufD